MNTLTIFIIIATLALIFSIIGTILGLIAVVKTLAVEKSTHTITYQSVDTEIDKANEEYIKKDSNKDNNWATKASAFASEQELFQEDLETEMPDFYPDEDDRKIRSF
jgi:hypothetical protein